MTTSDPGFLILRSQPTRTRPCSPHPHYALSFVSLELLLPLRELCDQCAKSGKILFRNPCCSPYLEHLSLS